MSDILQEIEAKLDLADVQEIVAGLPEDDQNRVQCIASTLRNILSIGEPHAEIAYALVGAEIAASAASQS